jgi:hypothetical protein
MNSNDYNKAWLRLTEAALRAPMNRDELAPYGFATRMAAMAMTQPKPNLAFAIDHFSWRALAAALTIMVASIVSSYAIATNVSEDETIVQDPVSEYIELAS